MSKLLEQIQKDHASIQQNMMALLTKVADSATIADSKNTAAELAKTEATITVVNAVIVNLASMSIALVKISDTLDRMRTDFRHVYGGVLEEDDAAEQAGDKPEQAGGIPPIVKAK